ncbi:cupredoxin domain-containing protein [Candidatus Woesearchaeota archaeon]|nr:cupredoxin domain-containing protein [Candidatus Woesearchaeota archaeon]
MKTNKRLQQIIIIVIVCIPFIFLISCSQKQVPLSEAVTPIPTIEQPIEKIETKTVENTSNSEIITEIKQSEPIIQKPKQTPLVVTIKKQNSEKTMVNESTNKEFVISADEKQFNPDSITVKKGSKVKINFNFNDDHIYFGGLDIKSEYFNLKYKKSDKIKTKTVEFTAEKTFSYSGYWPATNAKKASGKIVVE